MQIIVVCYHENQAKKQKKILDDRFVNSQLYESEDFWLEITKENNLLINGTPQMIAACMSLLIPSDAQA